MLKQVIKATMHEVIVSSLSLELSSAIVLKILWHTMTKPYPNNQIIILMKNYERKISVIDTPQKLFQ